MVQGMARMEAINIAFAWPEKRPTNMRDGIITAQKRESASFHTNSPKMTKNLTVTTKKFTITTVFYVNMLLMRTNVVIISNNNAVLLILPQKYFVNQ